MAEPGAQSCSTISSIWLQDLAASDKAIKSASRSCVSEQMA